LVSFRQSPTRTSPFFFFLAYHRTSPRLFPFPSPHIPPSKRTPSRKKRPPSLFTKESLFLPPGIFSSPHENYRFVFSGAPPECVIGNPVPQFVVSCVPSTANFTAPSPYLAFPLFFFSIPAATCPRTQPKKIQLFFFPSLLCIPCSRFDFSPPTGRNGSDPPPFLISSPRLHTFSPSLNPPPF